MASFSRLLASLMLLSLSASALLDPEVSDSAALQADDECEASSSTCGLNALQLSSRDIKQQDSEELGVVDEMYTFGAPGTAKPAFTNLASADGIFIGLRLYTENIFGVNRESSQVDGGAVFDDYLHPEIGVVALHWKEDSTYVPGRGHPSWPIQSQPGKAIFMDWGLHKEKNYQDRLNEITVLEMSTAITVDKMSVNNQELFRKARLMVSLAFGAYSDTPDMKAKARYGLPGWKVVAHEIQNTLEAKDSIWLVQEQDTMDCAFVFTGTSTFAELGTSIKSVGHPFCGFKEVHRGYQDKLYWLMKGLMPKLRPKMAQCNRMTCTGHSLGGSLCDVWSACANSKRTNDKHYKLQMWTKGVPQLMPEI
eukprot:CAMPEP_0115119376 /NCGR_PEP_ID=MMETSP0227-20121206/45054_1 /TAXON_ID=89957 /ORGANISM="Polarella glacialis, Strain CCMP 1383" /LENGTH=364 /DNA_ID=CAMNT_0002520833 /DNA_START=196 /DNA_END=1290 /DNA_ORIENTATION=+